MDRFSRFRRHKKSAAATTATVATATGDTVPRDTAATTQTSTQSPALPVLRPVTSAGLSVATPNSSATTVTAAAGENSRPMTSSSHTPSTSMSSSLLSVNGASSTPSSLDQNLLQQQQQKVRGPLRSSRSPFRNLLRSSAKRSRGSPSPVTTAPTLPRSPTAGLSNQLQNIALPSNGNASSPTRAASANGAPREKRRSAQSVSSTNKPTMPSFLTLSPHQIEHKFHDLVWMERNRLQSSLTAPTGRWSRVTGSHLRFLDRYMNIQPWDKNRVRLKVLAGQVDYINASPIVLTTTATAHAARPPDRYIAMQGPKQASADHVWRMVYEQMRSPAVIVMLTETHEANQEKCYPYFPHSPGDPPIMINEHDEFGDGFHASVHCAAIEETEFGDAIQLRRIVLRVHRKASPTLSSPSKRTSGANSHTDGISKPREDAANGVNAAKKANGQSPVAKANGRSKASKDEDGDSEMSEASAGVATSSATAASPSLTETNEAGASRNIDISDYEDERIVYHFLFKRWPDFGVPALEDVESFLGLMHLSAEKNADADNPRIVHCSAGVGRSGTFIAIEHLLRELDAGVLENYDCNGGPGDTEDESMEGTDDQHLRGRLPIPSTQQHDSSSSTSGGTSTADGVSIGSGAPESESQSPLEADDLIFTTVNQLREQRRTMVQAEGQYHFIYQVLRKLWQEKYGVVDSNEGQNQSQSQESNSNGVYGEEGSEGSEGSEPAAKRLEVDLSADKK